MGKKIGGLFAMLCVAAILLEIVGASMRWHATRFMAGPMTIFLLHTNFLYVKMDKGAGSLCTVVSKDLCEELEEGISLQEAQQHWCAPMVTSWFHHPCEAFNWAYILGMVGVVALVLNVVLLCVSNYLVYIYLESPKHKPQYRQSAALVVMISTGVLVFTFTAHNVQAVRLLDEMGRVTLLSGIVGASGGSGASYGCFVAWSGVLCQLVAASLFACMAVSDEPSEDQIEYEKMMKEEQRMQQGFESYGSQGNADFAPGYGSQGYGSQGYESHGYGNQGFANQGFADPGYANQGYIPPAAAQPQMPQLGQAAW